MKRFLTFILIGLMVFCSLYGCGCDDGKNVDLVFVNESDVGITTVTIDGEGGTEGAQRADGSPLNPGESFGFEVGKYPVTVTVYGKPADVFGEKKLGQVTISQPPAYGERWCVAARNGVDGLTLTWDVLRSGV